MDISRRFAPEIAASRTSQEGNETNNNLTQQVFVHVADLTFNPGDPGWSPDPAPAGCGLMPQKETLNATLRNVGAQSASNVKVAFYDQGVPVVNVTVSSIAAGGSATVSGTEENAVPCDSPALRNITVVADPNSAVVEESETNNTFTRWMPVTITAPDLVLVAANMTLSDANPDENATLYVNATIYNAGTAGADGLAALVPVALLDNGTIVAWQNLTVFASGTSQSVNFTYAVGWGPDRVGIHNVTVSVDPSNAVRELSESNNLVTKQAVFGRLDVVATLSGLDGQGVYGVLDQAMGNVNVKFRTTQRPLGNYAFSLPIDYAVLANASDVALVARLMGMSSQLLRISVCGVTLHVVVGAGTEIGPDGIRAYPGMPPNTLAFAFRMFNMSLRTDASGNAPFRVPWSIAGGLSGAFAVKESFLHLKGTATCLPPAPLPSSVSVPFTVGTPANANVTLGVPFLLGGLIGLDPSIPMWLFGGSMVGMAPGIAFLAPPPALPVPCAVVPFVPHPGGPPGVPTGVSVDIPTTPTVDVSEVLTPPPAPNVANVPGVYLGSPTVQWSGLTWPGLTSYQHAPGNGGDLPYIRAQIEAVNETAMGEIAALKSIVDDPIGLANGVVLQLQAQVCQLPAPAPP